MDIEYFYNDIVFRNWDFIITYSMVVENTVGWPNYNWMPDGHISTLQVPVNNIATAYIGIDMFQILIHYISECELRRVVHLLP